MIYALAYPICTLMVVLVSFWYLITRKDMRRRNSKLLLAVLITEIVEISLQITSVALTMRPGGASPTTLCVVNFIFYLFHYLVAAVCAFYLLNFYGVGHRLSGKWNVLFYVPYIATCLVPMLLGIRTGALFMVDAQGFPHAGSLLLAADIGSLLYFFVITVAAIRYSNELSKSQNTGLLLLVGLAAVSSIVDSWVFDSTMFGLFFVALGLLVLLIAVDHENWLYSNTTGTYNRMTLFEVVIVQMSADVYFQAVSQQEAIFQTLMTQIGNYMKELRYRPDIYYLERGTFLVTIFRDSRWQGTAMAETLADRFRKTWKVKWESGDNRELMIPVRILVGAVPSELASIKDVMTVADIPYNAEENQTVILSAKELIESEKREQEAAASVADAHGNASELPAELSMMLESFTNNVGSLTPSERRIVLYYLNGYEIADIPELDGITINTVRKHNKNIYRKLQISSREELMMYLDVLERCGMLEPIETLLKEGVEDLSVFKKASGEVNGS
jgi:DNA-binding CsgD family transcriptional regulator